MNGSSNQLFSKSWQRPGNLAMMASVAAHGVLFAGLALVPATGQQTDKKQLRVVSLLKSQPNPGPRPNQAIDPNAPPPAPGVAGLPLNITTPDGLAELPVTDTPNPAFDPFASSIVELPPPPPQTSFTPFNPNSLASLPPRRTPAPPQQTPPPSNSGPSLSDEDFQAWLNGTSDLPNLPPDPGSTGPLPPPGTAPGPVASNIPPANPANVGGIDSSDNPNDSNSLASSSIVPPDQSVKRFVAYDYPKDACQDRLEGKAEYRIWVSSKAAPVVSDIVLSTNSPILDRAVQNAAKKYKIKAEDANKIVVLPFDIKYSQSVCAVKKPDPPTPEPVLPPATPPAPTPKPAPTNTAPETPSPAQPLTPPTPAAPQPNLPPVNPARPVPPTAPQPPAQSAPALPPQPAQPPAPVAPAPSNPVQPAVPIQEPPTNSDLPPEPAAPQPAPAPPTSPQPPAAAPPAAPSAPTAPAAAPIPSAAPAAPPTGDAPAN